MFIYFLRRLPGLFFLFSVICMFLVLIGPLSGKSLMLNDGALLSVESVSSVPGKKVKSVVFSPKKNTVEIENRHIIEETSRTIKETFLIIRYNSLVKSEKGYSLKNNPRVYISRNISEIRFPAGKREKQYVVFGSRDIEVTRHKGEKVILLKCYYYRNEEAALLILADRFIDSKKKYHSWLKNRKKKGNPFRSFYFNSEDLAALSSTRPVTRKPITFDFIFRGTSMIPVGGFGARFLDIFQPGYGFSAEAAVHHLFIDNLTFFFETGYHYFGGRPGWSDKSYMVPLLPGLSYGFSFSSFTIAPRLGAGVSYNSVRYDDDYISANGLSYTVKGAFEPAALIGLGFSYTFFENFLLHCTADYRLIFEKGGTIQFITCSLGMGIRI